ncbi:uncharacterized protein ACRADG_004203 [Cochliomyia hominivorax]
MRHDVYDVHDKSDDDDDEEKRTLFCANLDERVTEELLYEIFLQAGPIESARIPKDPNGRQRTFGFITYVHKCTPPYAMQLYQGLQLFRKTLTIKYQRNTQPSPMRNYTSPGYNNKQSRYDNSSLRGGNYGVHNDSPPKNPFNTSFSPDNGKSSGRQHDNIGKYPSSQRRPHANSSPYQRKSTGSEDRYRDRDYDRERNRDRDRERDRDHNRKRHYNNGSNRHSDQRKSGGKHHR